MDDRPAWHTERRGVSFVTTLTTCNVCGKPVDVCGECNFWYCDSVVALRAAFHDGNQDLPGAREYRCDLPLLSSGPVPLPTHVCSRVAIETVDRFRQHRFWRENLLSDRLASGPLPAGGHTLALFADQYHLDVQDLLPPLLHNIPNAYVGLVVERAIGEETATHFGLVQPVAGHDNSLWEFVDCRVPTTDPSPEIVAEARKLQRFFRKHLLHQRLKSPGRPPGIRPDLAQLQDDYETAIRECHREHDKVSYKHVAERMGIGEPTLRKYINDDHVLDRLAPAGQRLRGR